MNDLVMYKRQQHILDNSFETPFLLSLSLVQNKHINTTLNTQVIFTSDGKVQRILIHELANQI
jgi:hypothetical protein